MESLPSSSRKCLFDKKFRALGGAVARILKEQFKGLQGVEPMGRVRARLSAASNRAAGSLSAGVAFLRAVPSKITARRSARVPGKTAGTSSQLVRFVGKLQEGDSVLIVAFGDSVTLGCTRLEARDLQAVYHNQLKRHLENKYPRATINVINSGVGGDNTSNGLARIDKSVLRYSPDLVLIGFGLNDSVKNGWAGIESFKRAIAEMIEVIGRRTSADIVLLTPNFMATSDNPNVHEEHRRKGYAQTFPRIQNAGVLARYAEAIRQLGIERNVAVADVYSRWERIAEVVDTNSLLANGLNHPDARGHCIVAETVMRLIDRKFVYDLAHMPAITREETHLQPVHS